MFNTETSPIKFNYALLFWSTKFTNSCAATSTRLTIPTIFSEKRTVKKDKYVI